MDTLRSRYVVDTPDSLLGSERSDGELFTLAPSDLTFVLHECPRCFWMMVTGARRRPQSPMPGVFTRLDRIQRNYFDGRKASEVHPSLASGRLDCSDLKIASSPLTLEDSDCTLRIRGAIDALIEFDDGTYGIIDFKTSSPGDAAKAHYGLQLHAYALALEQADWLHRACTPVTHLG